MRKDCRRLGMLSEFWCWASIEQNTSRYWAKPSKLEQAFHEGWADCQRIAADRQQNLAKSSGIERISRFKPDFILEIFAKANHKQLFCLWWANVERIFVLSKRWAKNEQMLSETEQTRASVSRRMSGLPADCSGSLAKLTKIERNWSNLFLLLLFLSWK